MRAPNVKIAVLGLGDYSISFMYGQILNYTAHGLWLGLEP